MVAHMNAQALAQTIATGDAVLQPLAQDALAQGEESGHTSASSRCASIRSDAV